VRRADFKSQISGWQSRRAATASLIGCFAFFGILLASTGFGAQPTAAKPPSDGIILAGVDGKLVPGDAADPWTFELVADVNSISGPIVAGTRFELLPCTTLER